MRMKITQQVRSALRRSWSYLATSLRKREELVPLERDPVGEFLNIRNAGVELPEEEAKELTQTPPAPNAAKPADAINHSEPVSADKVVGEKEIETLVKEAEVELKADAEVVAATGSSIESIREEKGKKEVALAENNEESELKAKAVTKEELQAAESSSHSLAVESKPVEKKGSQENGDVEGLLDVFRSEESESNTLGGLTKNLLNMNIYSLLEESKQVAAKMRGKKKDRPEV